MGVNKWLFNKFKSINYERLNRTIDVIEKENNKSRLFIKYDMIKNFLTYGCSYTDYFRCNYINLTKEEKKTCVTAKSFYKFLSYMNQKEYKIILNDKLVFNRYFKNYINRDWIDIRSSSLENFKSFLNKKDTVFAKTPNGEGGHGVSKINVKETDINKLYKDLIKRGQYLVEEAIIQSKEVNEINSNVVNSFRVVSIYKNGEVFIVNNALRVNQGDHSVIGCTDDIYFSLDEKGIISSNVVDDYGNIYSEHPLTHKKFSEVKIKGVKEALLMVEKLHKEIPQVRYIGWDFAFTDDGPELVEGNEYPGYGLFQFYKLHNKRTGHLEEISKILGDEMKDIKL